MASMFAGWIKFVYSEFEHLILKKLCVNRLTRRIQSKGCRSNGEMCQNECDCWFPVRVYMMILYHAPLLIVYMWIMVIFMLNLPSHTEIVVKLTCVAKSILEWQIHRSSIDRQWHPFKKYITTDWYSKKSINNRMNSSNCRIFPVDEKWERKIMSYQWWQRNGETMPFIEQSKTLKTNISLK